MTHNRSSDQSDGIDKVTCLFTESSSVVVTLLDKMFNLKHYYTHEENYIWKKYKKKIYIPSFPCFDSLK